MLMHKNIIADVEAILKIAPHINESEVFLSFLPLAHTYERTAGHFLPVRLGASIGYCESLRTVDKNMVEVRPTLMACVPRLLEASREQVVGVLAILLPDKKKASNMAAAIRTRAKSGRSQGGRQGRTRAQPARQAQVRHL